MQRRGIAPSQGGLEGRNVAALIQRLQVPNFSRDVGQEPENTCHGLRERLRTTNSGVTTDGYGSRPSAHVARLGHKALGARQAQDGDGGPVANTSESALLRAGPPMVTLLS